jgi:hypothetical protein
MVCCARVMVLVVSRTEAMRRAGGAEGQCQSIGDWWPVVFRECGRGGGPGEVTTYRK